MSTIHKRNLSYYLIPLVLVITAVLVVLATTVFSGDAITAPPGAGNSALATAGSCAECHDDTTLITGMRTEWSESLHATGDAYVRGSSASCAGCHSGGTFSQRVAAGLSPNQVTEGDTHPTRQDCRTCHQVHTSYTLADWALETTAPVSLYATPGNTFDGGNGNLCTSCHQARRDFPGDPDGDGVVTGISTHWGPHHGPQEPDADGSRGSRGSRQPRRALQPG